MDNKILLILSSLYTDDDRIAIERDLHYRDVKVKGDSKKGDGRAIEMAFRYAKSTSKKVVALQILTSNLYHWGRNDIILSGPAKTKFLLYIREEVLRRGEAEARVLKERARKRKISLEVRPIETEEVASAVVAEAKKGYGIIFLPKEKKKLFPLLDKTLGQHLRKKTSRQIVEC